MSRLAWAGDEENAFLFAVLGVLGLGSTLSAHGERPPAEAPTDDPILWALLGWARLQSMVQDAVPAGGAPAEPPPAAVSAEDHLLR